MMASSALVGRNSSRTVGSDASSGSASMLIFVNIASAPGVSRKRATVGVKAATGVVFPVSTEGVAIPVID
jgi:hypothetical protein